MTRARRVYGDPRVLWGQTLLHYDCPLCNGCHATETTGIQHPPCSQWRRIDIQPRPAAHMRVSRE